MKKHLPKLIFIAVVLAVIVGGKAFIDYKTIDYKNIVNDGISNFFISGNTSELEPVIELLDKYANDEEIRKEIQDYGLDVVESWIAYLDNKYYCDKSNLNSCIAQLGEFEDLLSKLTSLYETKGEKYTIIAPSSYNFYMTQGNEKVKSLKKIVESPVSSSPHDSERIRITKCATATDCTSCRDNICTCIYTDVDRSREEVQCFVLNSR